MIYKVISCNNSELPNYKEVLILNSKPLLTDTYVI
jgi:hypothetical protein